MPRPMEPLHPIISSGRSPSVPSNLFDCAALTGLLLGHCVSRLMIVPVGIPMFEAVAAFLVVLSIGILFAHALDAFRS